MSKTLNKTMRNMSRKIPPTTYRVPLKTCASYNRKIRNETLWNLYCYKNSSKNEITKRLKELNKEWDTERVLEANAATLVIISTLMGLKWSRCYFLITGTVGAFLLKHALYGWCPPIPFIRKMGIRTSEEINNEKIVLKHLRGDFENTDHDIDALFNMAIKQ